MVTTVGFDPRGLEYGLCVVIEVCVGRDQVGFMVVVTLIKGLRGETVW